MSVIKLHKAIAMMKMYGAGDRKCKEFALANKAGKRLPARARASVCKEDIRGNISSNGNYTGSNKYLAKAVNNVILPFSTSGK